MKSELLTKKQLSLELYDKFGQYPIFRKWGKEGRHVRAEVPKFEGITSGVVTPFGAWLFLDS